MPNRRRISMKDGALVI